MVVLVWSGDDGAVLVSEIEEEIRTLSCSLVFAFAVGSSSSPAYGAGVFSMIFLNVSTQSTISSLSSSEEPYRGSTNGAEGEEKREKGVNK